MRYWELMERAPQSNIFALAKIAYRNLSYQARSALDAWESANWHNGPLITHLRANDEIAQEIEQAFAPIRAQLPETITLYRGIMADDNYHTWKDALLSSWTPDRRVAELFAGLRAGKEWSSTLYTEVSDEEIENVVRKYEEKGFVKFRNRYYIRNKEQPEYYNIYDGSRQFVTDGDDLLRDLHRDNEWNKELNAEKNQRGTVFEEEISRDRVVWITNQLNCKEFIVRI